ncbi:unnamed protein product [Cylicocyclus nassatus]|uniref:Uncharacterized protein n=1 Tax=Cylicocyclus nassatus TaxID=53992 RepID=A0AA36HD59_CYLNA|nr:unnamed protein product [Cylicocyclus nassatus]
MIPGGGGLFYFSHGPCRYIGPFACYVGFSFLLHCYTYGLYSLVFSFCYRYYILLRPPPKIRNVAMYLILLYVPSLLQFVVFNLSSDSENLVKSRITKVFGYDMSTECVSGTARILVGKHYFHHYM